MLKKKILKNIQLLVKKKGGKCLAKKYVNSSTKMKWKCKKRHEWEAIYNSIQQGSWCPYCAGNLSKTLKNAQLLAKKKGGECLSKKYINNSIKIKWKCKEGHKWNQRYNTVQQGSWCPYCAGNLPKTLKDAQLLAKKKGGKCLSEEYVNGQIEMKWKCKEGHEWNQRYNTVQQGCWCPYCFRNTLKDAQLLAKEREGKCLSKEYVNYNTKMKWQCKYGHIWEAAYSSVQQGSWCPYCAGNARNTLKDAQLLAKKKVGKCLSKEYVNNNTKIKWQCKKGHKWETIYANVRQGSWCPICSAKFNISQNKLASIVKSILKCPVKYNYKGFDWLKTKCGGKQEIDIWVPKLKLAIEYDGRQHFKAIGFFGGKDGLKERKRLDALKNKKIKKHPEDVKYFVRLSYEDDISREHVIEKLKKCGAIR